MASDRITHLDARATIVVGDLEAALEFWTEVVGFDLEVTMGEPPAFAMVRSGDAHFALTRDDHPPGLDICPLFVTLEGLDVLVERLTEAGVALESEPTVRPWGLRDIVVRCPGEGPLVAFGEPVPTPTPSGPRPGAS